MNYILRGDFGLPLTYGYYWARSAYSWSFQNGAPNLDGIIRLPGRLLDLLAFAFFGNIVASYVFIASSLLLIFVSFYLFAKHFLGVTSRLILCVVCLLFTFNPAFLGNLAKIGIVAAAGLLPLCLVALKKFIETRRLSFLIAYILMLNFSLVHPFTFAVNFLISGAYLLNRLVRKRELFRSHGPTILVASILAVLLNAYFLLPVANIGTIDKAALSQDVSGQPVDYTSIVNVATTKDIFTAFSLSKDVFKDFDFYNAQTKAFYMVGIYAVYIVTFVLFFFLRPGLTRHQNSVILVMLSALLGLTLLTSGMALASQVITALINLPGGWIFRSPLKWQLYVPFFLMAALALLLGQIKRKDVIRPLLGVLLIACTLSSTYLFLDINEHLLKPKTIKALGTFARQNLDDQSMLFISGKDCGDYSRNHPDVLGEFNEIATSHDLQVKTAGITDVGRLNLSDYSYVMTCGDDVGLSPVMGSRFKSINSVGENGLHLYSNTIPAAAVNSLGALDRSPEADGVNAKQLFAQEFLHRDFSYSQQATSTQATELSQLFGDVTSQNIKGAELVETKPLQTGPTKIFNADGSPAYFREHGSDLFLSAQSQPGYLSVGESSTVNLTGNLVRVHYQNSNYHYQNLVSNGSFESGTWRPNVSDCYNYDDNPILDMKLDTRANKGHKALSLIAGRHVACTDHPPITVAPNANYLFEFSYQSDNRDNSAGFSIIYNDPAHTVLSEQPNIANATWHRYSKMIQSPKGATQVEIYLYGHPPDTGTQVFTTRYDDVQLTAMPPVSTALYMTSGSPKPLSIPASTSSEFISPTKRDIAIKGVKGLMVLRVGDTYNPKWTLTLVNAKEGWLERLSPWAPHGLGQAGSHLRLNNYKNAWYVDTTKLCHQSNLCQHNANGTYDLLLTSEYWPQRWFQLGLAISGITFLGCFFGWAYSRRHFRISSRRETEPSQTPTDDKPDPTLPKPKRRKVRLG